MREAGTAGQGGGAGWHARRAVGRRAIARRPAWGWARGFALAGVAALGLVVLGLVGCADDTDGPPGVPPLRAASYIEREHLAGFLAPGAGILSLHVQVDSGYRVVLGWMRDPLKAEPTPGVWRFAGTDSLSAGQFLPLTSASERLAPAPELVRLPVRDTLNVDALLRWLERHPPTDSIPTPRASR